MKNPQPQISIAEPCSQNWEEMEKRDGYNFCEACSKCVVDFTDYSNAEIIKTLANASTEVCGRLTETQLNQLNYYLLVALVNRNWMKYLGVLAIGFSIFSNDVSAFTIKQPIEIVKKKQPTQLLKGDEPVVLRTIYGYMFIAKDKPMVGLKLKIENTDFVAVTDKNGRYEFKIDDRTSREYNTIITQDSEYITMLKINFSAAKQPNYFPYKGLRLILGKIQYVPQKNVKH